MRLKHRWERYDSKLANIVSFLKGGFAGFIIFLILFFIPAFICLFVGVEGYIVGMLFGILGVSAIITFVLFVIFVDPDKIDNHKRNRKNKKSKQHTTTNKSIGINLYNEEQERQNLAARAYIATEVSEELKKIKKEK